MLAGPGASGGMELIEVENDEGANDKERFVRGVERAVLDGRADVGVHSAKDLPAVMTAGLSISAVPPREDARDAWIGPGNSVEDLPPGTRVGTASLRRRAQLLALRPDLEMVELRGNVDTRLARLAGGEVDALVLAVAGLKRLGRESEIAFVFDFGDMVPAAGQGSLVVQCRTGEEGTERPEAARDHAAARDLAAERAVVATLEADCSSPVGVHARELGGRLVVDGFVGLPDGSEWLRDTVEGDLAHPEAVGRSLARRMNGAGARDLLERASRMDGTRGEGRHGHRAEGSA